MSDYRATFSADVLSADPALGVWCAAASPLVAEGLATLGFDYVTLDRQHSMIDDETTLAMIAIIDGTDTPTFVRVPEGGTSLISPVLDAGATGVIVPMIETAEAAQRAVDAACYPPIGRRSWGPMRHAFYTPGGTQPADGVVMVMLETAAGIERAPEILSVPGVAGAFMGPADLAQSLGLGPGAIDHDDVLSRCRTVIALCRDRGLVAGTGAHSIGLAQTWLRMGFGMVSLGRDVSMMRDVAAERLAAVRAVASEREGQPS
jgi:4-hydroxy-2-oxoheptanedioate aldolase